MSTALTEALVEVGSILRRIETKLDALIAGLVAEEQAEASRLAQGQEIECSWCRSAGRVVSNCPHCHGSGG